MAPPPHLHTAIRPLNSREHALFQELIRREAGISLNASKKALLVCRLQKRVRELGLTSFESYYHEIMRCGGAELTLLLDAIATNETHFFREPRQLDFLEHRVFPAWLAATAAGQRPRAIRAWSAACSTGEEPFTLAMMLRHHFPPSSGWQVEVLASDISTRVLAAARRAVWPMQKAREIPPRYLYAYMLRGFNSEKGFIKAGPEIRSMVRWSRINLNDDSYPVTETFDLVFCRNVLIYFEPELKTRVIHRLLSHLAPWGLLCAGHAESLHGVTDRVRSVSSMVYAHAAVASSETLP